VAQHEEDPNVEVTINGKRKNLNGPLTVAGLLESLGIDPDTVVVERNLNILRRTDHEKEVLEGGDAVEIIQMVNGG
jgi:thiamine biosynthesis protein ThiS